MRGGSCHHLQCSSSESEHCAALPLKVRKPSNIPVWGLEPKWSHASERESDSSVCKLCTLLREGKTHVQFLRETQNFDGTHTERDREREMERKRERENERQRERKRWRERERERMRDRERERWRERERERMRDREREIEIYCLFHNKKNNVLRSLSITHQ
ncbi:hypothetical protein FHG87_009834 [Trinorchestia longiramus]|nr:hypothetical protein FHG87_009834 [Trinorchestia longiramus]